MDPSTARKFEQYKVAFADHEQAVISFNHRILSITSANKISETEMQQLAYVLKLKHNHFIECACQYSERV